VFPEGVPDLLGDRESQQLPVVELVSDAAALLGISPGVAFPKAA